VLPGRCWLAAGCTFPPSLWLTCVGDEWAAAHRARTRSLHSERLPDLNPPTSPFTLHPSPQAWIPRQWCVSTSATASAPRASSASFRTTWPWSGRQPRRTCFKTGGLVGG
jgi:hypothetical protein